MSEAYIVTLWCPMPCLDVVFAKCLLTERIFAVCTCCGCAWLEPQYETWELGNLGDFICDPRDYAPQGFVLASRDEICQAGFESLITDVQAGSRWADEFDWYCKEYIFRET